MSLASSKLPDVGERSEKLKDVCKTVKEQLINLDQNQVVLDHVTHWRDIRKSGKLFSQTQDCFLVICAISRVKITFKWILMRTI